MGPSRARMPYRASPPPSRSPLCGSTPAGGRGRTETETADRHGGDKEGGGRGSLGEFVGIKKK